MEGIGGSIVNGAAGAVGGMIQHVPLVVWMILMGGLVIFGVLMRYLTNIKLDAIIVGVFIVLCLIVYYREHWINMGYQEAVARVNAAQAQVEAYKKTNRLIEDCYLRQGNVWDRSQGKCVAVDGSH